MSKRDAIAALERRIVVLEWARKNGSHVHSWQYSKTITGSADDFAGRLVTWGWKCLHAADGCGQPSGGTNHLGGVPDHFPDELR